MEAVFEIKGLDCSYDGQKVVLRIDELLLPAGGLYFFIGASGIGKSTLLETLGMMNKPYLPSFKALNYYSKKGLTQLSELWKSGDKALSLFRQKEYSFIFQDTNLMPQFTAGENMAYPLLLEGMEWAQAKKRVAEVMPMLDLDPNLMDRSIAQLSGGQRQRLAFVRGFVSTFEVIFADEPTGNLDPINAANVLSVLKEHLKSRGKTAIIVSHDIALAAAFADRIYYFKKQIGEDQSTSGYLTNDQYLERKEQVWMHKDMAVQEEIENYLKSYLL
jgi:ABC-type lipoprotein export system ATPase subunit